MEKLTIRIVLTQLTKFVYLFELLEKEKESMLVSFLIVVLNLLI